MKQVLTQSDNLVPLIRPNPLVAVGYETLLSDWLGLSSSRHTVRVYRQSIQEFFTQVTESPLNPEVLAH
jgi:hypothetical protein